MRLSYFTEHPTGALQYLARPLESLSLGARHLADAAHFAMLGMRERHKKPPRTLRVWPRPPLPFYTLWSMAQVLGLTLTSRPAEHAILFADETIVSAPTEAAGWINGRCTDISKSRVAAAFARASGRRLAVDPRTHAGPMVEKSETNGLHDGRIVEGPKEPQAGKAYERLINNVVGDETEDLRVAIVGSRIPIGYRKRRPRSRRFNFYTPHVELFDPTTRFSPEEIDMVLAVAREAGLDFGEIDTLRDYTDGKLYVVDVNKTSMSPPIGLPYAQRLESLRIVADAFEREFL